MMARNGRILKLERFCGLYCGFLPEDEEVLEEVEVFGEEE